MKTVATKVSLEERHALRAGFKLVWSDEFSGDAVDPANWGYELGDGCQFGICGELALCEGFAFLGLSGRWHPASLPSPALQRRMLYDTYVQAPCILRECCTTKTAKNALL